MTAKELASILSSYPADTELFIHTGIGGYYSVSDIVEDNFIEDKYYTGIFNACGIDTVGAFRGIIIGA